MNLDNIRDKEFRELNHHQQDGRKRTNNGVVGEEQGLLEEDERKLNGIAEDVKDGHERAVHADIVGQIPQQPQGAMVCWERFLHIRSLKVLLVENDDSTRHVVAALLRNCSYEVIEAGNALQAWKILEDQTKPIDLVLTEVVMPCLSGIALLCKIVSHKTRKNVPVIMMSSHDSMGLVFKCLSKGAVDFLVKPIRKNELRNLWQHVWRRCHSSSGSGSESGTQTQNSVSVKSKSVQKSEDNTGSNGEDDNGSTRLNVGDGSDSGSGTQSSWTRQAMEIDSPRPVAQWDHIAECHDSTCAQVIHSNAESFGNKGVPSTAPAECQEQDNQLENTEMGKDLEINVPKNQDFQLGYPIKFPIKLVGAKQNNLLETGSSKLNEQIDRGHLDLNSGSPSSQLKHLAGNLKDVVPNSTDPQRDSIEFEDPNKLSKILDINKNTITGEELPSRETSLKRLRGVKDVGTIMQDERNVLRRSNSSAFSRYNTASYSNEAPTVKCFHPPSALQPINSDQMRTSHQVISDRVDGVAATTNLGQPRSTHQELPIQHFHHHYDHHHHLVHSSQHRQLPPDHGDQSFKKMAPAAPHYGSSNVLGGFFEGDTNVNGSASGSNHGSNGQNGGSTAVNAGGTNMESDNGMAGKNGSGDTSGSGSGSEGGNRVDQNKLAQREAALTKFRQKRKKGCFQKKVRSQSRKRLSEQRSRVRGQFVRQTENEFTSSSADG